jgi:hypothetical protein
MSRFLKFTLAGTILFSPLVVAEVASAVGGDARSCTASEYGGRGWKNNCGRSIRVVCTSGQAYTSEAGERGYCQSGHVAGSNYIQ